MKRPKKPPKPLACVDCGALVGTHHAERCVYGARSVSAPAAPAAEKGQ